MRCSAADASAAEPERPSAQQQEQQQQPAKQKQPKQPKQPKQGGGKKPQQGESTSSEEDIRRLRIQKAEV